MCHVSHVTIFFLSFFGQSGEGHWWRVCYQRGLPRLVFSHSLTHSLTHSLLIISRSHFHKGGRTDGPTTRLLELLRAAKKASCCKKKYIYCGSTAWWIQDYWRWRLFNSICCTLRSWVHEMFSHYKTVSSGLGDNCVSNVALTVFHTQNICHHARKFLRTTLWCFIVLQ